MRVNLLKKRLNDLQDLEKEIEETERMIAKLEKKVVTDVVKGSSSNYPYGETSFFIVGLPISLDRQRNALWRQISECQELIALILEQVSEIEEPRIRRIIKLRYIEKKSWCSISRALGSQHESYARKVLDRYFDNL